jgi:L-ascorbate metabolism protein UlaG (beta-lactamase superfamily)
MAGMKPRAKRRWLRRSLKFAGAMLLIVVSTAIALGWTNFGHKASGDRLARMARSPEWHDGAFVNPQPIINHLGPGLRGFFSPDPSTSPSAPPSTVHPDLRAAPASGLRVTWLGHSSMLLEIDGKRILTDPVWSERVTPIRGIGPQRWYPPPLPLDELPPIDAVVISHDHYDHLDRPTVLALDGRGAPFIVPLGVGAHLEYWGIPAAHITEVDWWQRVPVGNLEIVSTPARHASGRQLFDRDATLWSGYAFLGPQHRVYYSGDTGLFPALREIGEKLGPFDLTMIEIGQYSRGWPDWHIGPEQAVVAHQWLRGKILLPVHWGLFTLASHGWTEPIERVSIAAKNAALPLLTPRPGQTIEPTSPPPPEQWWPSLPYHSATDDPIISSQIGE